jgi:hypothetical protein
MRIITLCALGFALLAAGCQPSVTVPDYPLPTELSDCKLFKLSNGIDDITVARCPNSTTSTTFREGKHDETAVVVDGVAPDSPSPESRDALPAGTSGAG